MQLCSAVMKALLKAFLADNCLVVSHSRLVCFPLSFGNPDTEAEGKHHTSTAGDLRKGVCVCFGGFFNGILLSLQMFLPKIVRNTEHSVTCILLSFF